MVPCHPLALANQGGSGQGGRGQKDHITYYQKQMKKNQLKIQNKLPLYCWSILKYSPRPPGPAVHPPNWHRGQTGACPAMKSSVN